MRLKYIGGTAPGVLRRLTGKDAEKYMKEKSSGAKVSEFKITDVSDEIVGKILDTKFNSTNKSPTKGEFKDDPTAHVISDYKIFSINCATFVSNTLNEAGSDALERLPDAKTGESVHDTFSIPSMMGSFLHWQSNSILGNNSVDETEK